MKINQILIIGISVIIGIGLLAVVGATSQSALSGETEIINVEKNIVYEDLPIDIKAGDTFVTTLADFRAGIAYTVYIQNGVDPVTRWGFSTTGTGRDIWTNGTPFRFEVGTWDEPVFSGDYSNEYYTWVVVGDVGTITFLQDFPVTIDTMQLSTGTLTDQYSQPSSYETDVLSTSIEVPVYTTTDRLVQLVPFIGVLVLVGSVIVYIKIKH